MSLAVLRGRLREGNSGVDRSQAGLMWWANDREGDWSELWLDVIMRRLARSDRSVVTRRRVRLLHLAIHQEEKQVEKRYAGFDLHRNQFTVCLRLDLQEWKLEALPQFVKKLRPTDEVAVEVTGNTRLFYGAVSPYVARVVVVDTNQFA